MSELKPAKIGVVGCGNISDIYLKNSAWLDMIEIKGVTDLQYRDGQGTSGKIRRRLSSTTLWLIC